MTAPNLDFSGYLESIETHYEKWWEIDALTAAIEAQQASFTFKQKVQTEEKDPFADPEDRTKIRTLDLIPGIQEYATVEPVLLVGSPGVGKSSALLRCLVEYAKQELAKPEPERIPVLIRLKTYQKNLISSDDPTGMLALIKNVLKSKFKRRIEISEIEEWLFEGRLILLLDGLNEMPSSSVRTQLQSFCEDLDQTSLICSTRELGAGSLGINRKLVIQPPDPEEINRFLHECILTDQVQKVESLLNRDRRELSRTPFVLWMLYHVIQETGAVADTLSEAFRQFFRSFKGRLETAPVTDERRKAWDQWLKHLAFTMLSSPEPTDTGLVISEEDAETALFEEFPPPYETPLLSELLKYHLLQEEKGKITFHHQLIQEYYAAEALLLKLDNLTDEELKCNYLNYLKWTEPIALMLALLEDENSEKASRVVKLALKVDWSLGARLAGEVRLNLQQPLVEQVNALEIPTWLKVELLGETRSRFAIPALGQFIQGSDSTGLGSAVGALEKIGHPDAVPHLIRALKRSRNEWTYEIAVGTLEKIALEYKIDLGSVMNPLLLVINPMDMLPDIQAEFYGDRGFNERWSEKYNASWPSFRRFFIPVLRNLHSEVQSRAAWTLGKIDPDTVSNLINVMQDSDYKVRRGAAWALSKIGYDAMSPAILSLQDSEPWIRSFAVQLLGEIGCPHAVPHLFQALQDSDSEVRERAAWALSKIGYDAMSHLSQALQDSDSKVRERAAWALSKIGDPVRVLQHSDPWVREMAVEALGKIDHPDAVLHLIQALQHSDQRFMTGYYHVGSRAAEVLGNFKNDRAAHGLPDLLKLISQDNQKAFRALTAIQANCKFYNYEIYQQAQARREPEGPAQCDDWFSRRSEYRFCHN